MRYYVLFDNHTQGLALHRLLDEADIPNRITSTPRCREIRVSCGMSLLISEKDIAAARSLIEKRHCPNAGILEIEEELNPRRDVYC